MTPLEMNQPVKRQISIWRKLVLTLWLLLWPCWMLAHLYPIRDSYTRLALVILPFLLWAGVLGLFWKQRAIRFVGGALLLLIAAITLLPGHAVDSQKMRSRYTAALRDYADTPYIWGGETRRGIDCSGLLRRALMDANLREGLQTFNPRPLRQAFSLWWHDCSAKAMRDEYRGWTTRLFTAPQLNDLDDSRLQPGDIAVTTGGQHCLAYLGEQTWIEADPSALVGDKVIQVKVPSKNAWFSTSMHILCWRQLADKQER